MIQITNACTVAFMKARNSLVVRYREKHVNWKKRKQKMVKIYFFKVLANTFWLTSQSCSWVHGLTKLFMADLLSNGLHEKVIICY